MQVKKKTISYSTNGKDNKPTVINWNDEPMIRGHSIQAVARQIVRTVRRVDVVKINIVGDMGMGKTTLARTISHLIHFYANKKYGIPFTVKEFTKEELLNFEQTVLSLEPVNTVLIFDDVSFISSKKNKDKIEEIKQKMTEIRHLRSKEDGSDIDVKIVIIMITHYTLALQKYLRQAQFSFFVTVGSSEMDNMLKLVGNHYQKLLYRFQKIIAVALDKGKYTFTLGKKDKFFTYRYQKPFAPILFHNVDKLRIIVSPMRDWIEPNCPICNHAQGNLTKEDRIPAAEFLADMEHKFGRGVARNAVRLTLWRNGINVYPKSVKHCLTYINKYVADKLPQFQELADHYNYSNDKTTLSSKYLTDIDPEKVKDLQRNKNK